MQRFDPKRPMRLAYVVGTFSAHPAVMGAMYEFLMWVTALGRDRQYAVMNRECAAWVRSTNARLVEEGLPVRVVHLGTIWTVLFSQPGRYNWLLQYYLRAEGVTLSWVGTGRCLASMDFTTHDYMALQHALVGATTRMKRDGWWLDATEYPQKEQRMKSRLVQEMLSSLVPTPFKAFHEEVMLRKKDDHRSWIFTDSVGHARGCRVVQHRRVHAALADHCGVLVVLDPVRDRRARRLSGVEVQFPYVDDLVRQARHGSAHRRHPYFPRRQRA
jgi:hypothetical protein